VVADTTACHANETPIAWNVQGTKDDPGPPGPPGPAGTVATLQSLAGTACDVHGAAGTLEFVEPAGLVATLQAVCVAPDSYEPNETQAAAAAVKTPPFGSFQVAGTIYPAGDEDWLALNPPNGLHGLSIVPFRSIAYEISVDGVLATSGTLDASSAPAQLAPPPGPHAFVVHVRAASAGGIAAYGIQGF
jgi:hypothetical protein